jgi:hypothetical protein
MQPKPIGSVPVVDVQRPFFVTIEEIDRKATQCSPTHCVFANAMNRQNGITLAQVGQTMVHYNKGNIRMRGELSHAAIAMIRAYDRDNQIMPAGIRIEILPPRRKKGTVKPKGPKTTKRDPSIVTRIVHNPSTRNLYVEPPNQ